jgi:hypothetical protein
MTATLIFVLAALALLAIFSVLAARRSQGPPDLNGAVSAIRSLDIDAFRNLLDPEEEDFLRANLPPAQFRRIRRERARVALAYVKALSGASLQFARFGDVARRNADPALAALGKRIATSAVYLRLLSLDASARLRLAVAFPALPARPLHSLLEQYDRAACLLLNHKGLSRAENRAS